MLCFNMGCVSARKGKVLTWWYWSKPLHPSNLFIRWFRWSWWFGQIVGYVNAISIFHFSIFITNNNVCNQIHFSDKIPFFLIVIPLLCRPMARFNRKLWKRWFRENDKYAPKIPTFEGLIDLIFPWKSYWMQSKL